MAQYLRYGQNALNLIALLLAAILTYDWSLIGVGPEVSATVAGMVLAADKLVHLGINFLKSYTAAVPPSVPPVVAYTGPSGVPTAPPAPPAIAE